MTSCKCLLKNRLDRFWTALPVQPLGPTLGSSPVQLGWSAGNTLIWGAVQPGIALGSSWGPARSSAVQQTVQKRSSISPGPGGGPLFRTPDAVSRQLVESLILG